jgi:tubulin polyglutamylase TTLL6/13
MNEIARKDTLGKNVNRMKSLFPQEYNFFPTTFTLPADYSELRALLQEGKKRTYIVKPDASSQGRGIYLTRSLDEIDPMGKNIVQQYISRVCPIQYLKLFINKDFFCIAPLD